VYRNIWDLASTFHSTFAHHFDIDNNQTAVLRVLFESRGIAPNNDCDCSCSDVSLATCYVIVGVFENGCGDRGEGRTSRLFPWGITGVENDPLQRRK